MCYYVGIEDLAANALIELIKRKEKSFVSFKEIEAYGAKVVELINKESNEEAVLILSREDTNALFRNYSNFFERKTGKGTGEDGIQLKEGVKIEDLIEEFRAALWMDILSACMAEYSLKALGV